MTEPGPPEPGGRSSAGTDAEAVFAMADYFAAHPDRAADVLVDARHAEALRLALDAGQAPTPQALVAEARRLEGSFRRRRRIRRLAPVLLGATLFGAGWLGHGLLRTAAPPGVPPVVEAALDAQAALDRRHAMLSQAESAVLDVEEIGAALGVEVPQIPAGWIVRDVQVVAAPDRPAVAIAFDVPELGRVLLFSTARAADDTLDPLTAFEYADNAVAMFEQGHSAYVLLDTAGHPDQLRTSATLLLRRG
ncbi:hypothetical protein [Acuticoccus sediminis]|uniref:hypothetical protein n=1 Tax=Acuticoccus sediminis TaxID=2184697 RepID=UPI001CFCCA7E|nr:hypothetical protein [Acuticoccus sediminis]